MKLPALLDQHSLAGGSHSVSPHACGQNRSSYVEGFSWCQSWGKRQVLRQEVDPERKAWNRQTRPGWLSDLLKTWTVPVGITKLHLWWRSLGRTKG